jgi:hypothetical protein
MLRVVGALLLVVVALWLVGAFVGAAITFVAWALVVGALVFAGVVVWAAASGRPRARR